MDVQAIVLRGLLRKDTWFSLRTIVTEDVITDPEARKVLSAIRRLHDQVEGDISLTSVRLDIESTYQMNESLRVALGHKLRAMESAELLDKRELDPVVRKYVSRERLMAGASYLSAHMDDEVFDYEKVVSLFETARDSSISFDDGLESYKSSGAPDEIKRRGVIPTYLSDKLDKALDGGHAIGELMVYLAPGNRGKTTAMVKTACGVARMGLNPLVIGLEVCKDQYCGLIDKELTGLTKEELIANPFLAMRKREQLPGEIYFKDWSAGIEGRKVTVGDIRNLLIAARRRGKSIDYLVVDYWELMGTPGHHREERFGLKEIGVGLRMLANEFQIPVLTAWQTNRSGYKAHLIEDEHIGEDISVKKTSDIIVTLNQNEQERRDKRMRLGLLKQRTSSKYPVVDCYWDIDRMVFRDRTDQDIEDNLAITGVKNEEGQEDGGAGHEDLAGAGLPASQ